MQGFESYRGRTVEPGERVQVYRKIVGGKVHGPLIWSIRGPEGLVRGHATRLDLTDAYAYVNTAASERIRAGQAREVHAWVNGTLSMFTTCTHCGPREFRRYTYQPHNADVFFDVETREPWTGQADRVVFNEEGMWI